MTQKQATVPLNQIHDEPRYQHQVLGATGGAPGASAVAIIPNFMGISAATAELGEAFVTADRDVLIVDVFGADGRPTGFDDAVRKSEALRADPRRLSDQVRSALELFVRDRPYGLERVGLVGFCFGGAVALELARTGIELRAVVGLHADLTTRWPAGALRHRSRILTVQGSADPLVPLAQRQGFQEEMARTEGVEWQLLVLGGLYHAFTDPAANTPGVSKYDAKGRQLSFRLANEFIG